MLGGCPAREQFDRKGSGSPGGHQVGHEPATCPRGLALEKLLPAGRGR